MAAAPLATTGRLVVLEPFATGDRFLVSAEAPSLVSPDDWSLTRWAVCADPLPGYEVVEYQSNLDSSTFKTGAAVCPSGKEVTGTGTRVDFSNGQVGMVLNRSSGPRDISRSSAREDADGYTGGWRLESYAICVNRLANTYLYGTIVDEPDHASWCRDLPIRPSTAPVSVGGGGGLVDTGPYFLTSLMVKRNPGIADYFSVSMSGLPEGAWWPRGSAPHASGDRCSC